MSATESTVPVCRWCGNPCSVPDPRAAALAHVVCTSCMEVFARVLARPVDDGDDNDARERSWMMGPEDDTP